MTILILIPIYSDFNLITNQMHLASNLFAYACICNKKLENLGSFMVED